MGLFETQDRQRSTSWTQLREPWARASAPFSKTTKMLPTPPARVSEPLLKSCPALMRALDMPNCQWPIGQWHLTGVRRIRIKRMTITWNWQLVACSNKLYWLATFVSNSCFLATIHSCRHLPALDRTITLLISPIWNVAHFLVLGSRQNSINFISNIRIIGVINIQICWMISYWKYHSTSYTEPPSSANNCVHRLHMYPYIYIHMYIKYWIMPSPNFVPFLSMDKPFGGHETT